MLVANCSVCKQEKNIRVKKNQFALLATKKSSLHKYMGKEPCSEFGSDESTEEE